eukprot:TRINITY_DN16764_c0_g1_i1.p2 TRINITY_DN16764_c0_g1~~TRINITY_DN16764_c0_g1_i1.p2  ORF type:complete len:275 (+),score=86.03 TRINITY_DN16764_c0_g1_i1:50-874(+)
MAAVPASAVVPAAWSGPPRVQPGKVYLVGAGPGADELLTVRAARILSKADVCFYDRLSGVAGMRYLPEKCERISVGKRQGEHPVPQRQINQLMAEAALQGKTVVRLKGGDPFVFGRGGEELSHLQRFGVPFEVVPGVTAAVAAGAYSGIPLTHRGFARSALLTSAVDRNGAVDVSWAPLVARGDTTVAVYMGGKALSEVCGGMLAAGVAADMPMAAIEAATTPKQKVITGTIATMPALVKDSSSHSLFVIGNVVRLEPLLRWNSKAAAGGGSPS